MKGRNHKPTFIIADDFSGANDVGVAFANAGRQVSVLLDSSVESDTLENADVFVICTDSRDLTAADAFLRLRQTCDHFRLSQRQPQLIKKVDSTLRGNVGAEIDALLHCGYDMAVIAIAAPEAKRQTRGGLCYVDGVPLAETEFASDPKSPVRSSRILDIIRAQCELPCGELNGRHLFPENVHPENVYPENLCLEDFADGASIDGESADRRHSVEALHQRLWSLRRQGKRVVICDAQSPCDLNRLYQATTQLPVTAVFVTTGELTQVLMQHESDVMVPRQPPRCNSPLLAIIGSMSAVTFRQVNRLQSQTAATLIEPDIERVLQDQDGAYLHHIVARVNRVLAMGRHCVVRSCRDPHQRHQLVDLSRQYQLTPTQLSEKVRDFLGQIPNACFHPLVQDLSIGGLILCGGDIALSCAQTMNAPVFSLQGHFDCMPWGYLTPMDIRCPIFTKAGGFGDETVFLQLIQQIQKEV
jgi:uncharacterized protein YgbK (DUF1537 family)